LADITDSKYSTENFTILICLIAPSGSILSPVNGHVIDRFGFAIAASCVVILGLFMNGLASIPNLPTQLVTIFIWGVFRNFHSAITHSSINHFFGYHYFGRMNGILWFVGGLISLLQSPLQQFVITVLDSNYFIVNITFFAVSFLTFIWPIYLWRRNSTSKFPIKQ